MAGVWWRAHGWRMAGRAWDSSRRETNAGGLRWLRVWRPGVCSHFKYPAEGAGGIAGGWSVLGQMSGPVGQGQWKDRGPGGVRLGEGGA